MSCAIALLNSCASVLSHMGDDLKRFDDDTTTPAPTPPEQPAVTPADAAPPQPVDLYWMFAGPMNEVTADRFIRMVIPGLNQAKGATHHIALQSAGGNVGDGVWLHNFFKACPQPLIVYNVGTIASAGVIAFLGAAQRKANRHATFMLHRTTFHPQTPHAKNLAAAGKLVALDDARIDAILSEHITLATDQKQHLEHHHLWLSADEALAVGLITGIDDFAPPKGMNLLMI